MSRLKRNLRVVLWGLTLGALALALSSASAQTPEVLLVEAKGTVNPVMAGFLGRAIAQAEKGNAPFLIIQLDTPGGLDKSMRDIVQRILSSRVPIVVYVSPPGARAASAGAFITMAAHVAAMAPNTAIGAAHPVSIGSQGQPATPDKTMEDKVVNDAVAYIKSTAQMRARNVLWAEKAVRESVSATAQEAVEQRIVDLMATDVPGLLASLDGREVKLISGPVILNTKGVTLKPLAMTPWEEFLFILSDPNLAFMLLSLAMLGLFLELSNPGAILPGVVGGILLILALFSLGSLPVNWAAVMLIALAFILFVLEVFVASHGILAVGGVISLILGGMMLVQTSSPAFSIDRRLIIGVAAAMASFFLFVVGAMVKARRLRVFIGRETMIGKLGVARTELNPEGLVFIDGERWIALAEGEPVALGEQVKVTKIEGLKVWVTSSKQG